MSIDKTTEEGILNIQDEAIYATQNKNFSGLMQIFSLASVVNLTIYSVYPKRASTARLQALFHGNIESRLCSYPPRGMAYILWTGLDIASKGSGGSIRTYFKPNHLVPIFLKSSDVAEVAEVW